MEKLLFRLASFPIVACRRMIPAFVLVVLSVLLLPVANAGVGAGAVENVMDVGTLYKLKSDAVLDNSKMNRFASIKALENELVPVKEIQFVDGSYWLKVPLEISEGGGERVVYVYGSYIKTIRAFLLINDLYGGSVRPRNNLYQTESFQARYSGHNESHEYPLHYAMTFSIEANQDYTLWVNMESEYFTGSVRVEILTVPVFEAIAYKDSLMILGCLGATLILAIYNFVVYFWSRAKEYLYYALYLFFVFLGWASVFGISARLFENYEPFLIVVWFQLCVVANTLFYQKFLDLRDVSPGLCRIGNAISVMSLLMLSVFFLVPLWVNYMFIIISNSLWLSVGFVSGVVRLRSGYRPARFFVAGFVVVMIGAALIITPYFGFVRLVYNEYLCSLIAQTLDVVFLAWALVYRINLLRLANTKTLKEARDREQYANSLLVEANQTLLKSLEQSKENEQKKDDFIMAVSHELRTPLNIISGSLDQINYVQDPAAIEDLTRCVRFGADRLSTQVENIVTLSEVDDYDSESQKKDVRLMTLLGLLREESTSYLFDKPVSFTLEMSDSLSEYYHFDQHLVHRVLAPVIDNACKYTENGMIIMKVVPYEGGVEFTVIDTGPGVSEEVKATMFDEFVQASRGYQRDHEGLGLGLSICQRLLQLLGGHVNVSNVEGAGACFVVRIPMEAADTGIIDLVGVGGVGDAKLKPIEGHALIVEDNLINAKVLTALIKRLGLSSDLAENGELAVEAVKETSYDVIFMDLQMPVMDGFAATEEIRRLGIHCPIIAVTANSDYQARIRCLGVGMNDFISKPVKKGVVLDAVTKLLGQAKFKLLGQTKLLEQTMPEVVVPSSHVNPIDKDKPIDPLPGQFKDHSKDDDGHPLQ